MLLDPTVVLPMWGGFTAGKWVQFQALVMMKGNENKSMAFPTIS